jgi:hypothetical protein
MQELQLHDIKGFVEIPDNSIYYFYSVIFLIVVIAITAIYFLLKYLKREKSVKLQKSYLEALTKLDFSDSKQTAYELSHYGHLLEKDEEQCELFEKLLAIVEVYKYQKEVPTLSKEHRQTIENFLEAINAR